jgi:hypothetical protein
MLIFTLIITVGFAYELGSGALQIDSRQNSFSPSVDSTLASSFIPIFIGGRGRSANKLAPHPRLNFSIIPQRLYFCRRINNSLFSTNISRCLSIRRSFSTINSSTKNSSRRQVNSSDLSSKNNPFIIVNSFIINTIGICRHIINNRFYSINHPIVPVKKNMKMLILISSKL